jgi:ATP-dependent Clp protease adaptor protein ClpS
MAPEASFVDKSLALLTVASGLGALTLVGYRVVGALNRRRRRKVVSKVVEVLLGTMGTLYVRNRKNPEMTLEHLLMVLLHVPDVAAALRDRDVPLSELRAQVNTHLAALETVERTPLGPECSPQLLGVVRTAARKVRGETELDAALEMIEGLLLELSTANESFAQRILATHGIDRDRPLVLAPSDAPRQGRKNGQAAPETNSRADVILWNDKVTTMEGVIAILTQCFPMNDTEATYLMATVHVMGRARVWTGNRDQASEHAVRCTALARARGWPLRVSVEELADDPEWLGGWG